MFGAFRMLWIVLFGIAICVMVLSHDFSGNRSSIGGMRRVWLSASSDLWAPYHPSLYKGRKPMRDARESAAAESNALAFCVDESRWAPFEDSELSAVLDCICNPAVERLKHCRYIIVQSGDYALERQYRGIEDMPFYLASQRALQLYAAAHGYSYLYVDLRDRRAGLDRAAAWMKLPLISLLGRYFDHVMSVDPDVVPGLNFTLSLRHLSDMLQPSSRSSDSSGGETQEKAVVFAGNAPSLPGGPCTGAMLFKFGPPYSVFPHSRLGERVRGARLLLQYWWTAPDRQPDEFGAYKQKHVWEQQIIDRLVRKKTEFAGNLSIVLPPAVMGNPESAFMQHFWSEPGPNAGAERHRRVQRGLLETLALAVTTCYGGPHCAERIARIASWRYYVPVVRWGELYGGTDFPDAFWSGDG